jgi:hypothetical protein
MVAMINHTQVNMVRNVYIYTYSSQHRHADQAKEIKKKNWMAVNVVCQVNLSVCDLGTPAMRFASPIFSSVNNSSWPRTGVILAVGQFFYDTMFFSIKLYILIDTRLAQSL